MSIVRALRTLSALENGTLTGAQLNTLLTGSSRQGELAALFWDASLCARMAASYTTMLELFNSSLARVDVLRSPVFMQAIWANDRALSALVATAAAMSDARSTAAYSVVSDAGSGSTPVTLTLPGTKYIVLGTSRATTATTAATISTKRANTTMSNSLPTSGTSNTAGMDFDVALPIQYPFSFVGYASSATQYFGVLRCDI